MKLFGKNTKQEESLVMHSFQKGTSRSQAGPEQDHGKQKLFGTANVKSYLPVSTNAPGSLAPVDVEQLRARLISAVPRRPQTNADALVFPHRTKAQERQLTSQRPVQVEMLVRTIPSNEDSVYKSFVCPFILLIHFGCQNWVDEVTNLK